MDDTATADGTDLMRELIPDSPLVRHLGIEVVDLDDGHGVLRLPFRDEVVTIGRIVHGGAIAALIDTAAMAAAWAGAEVPESLRGATVGLTVHYLAAVDGRTVTATADVVRRGRRLVTVHVDAHADDATHVATSLVTYQLG